VGPGVEAMKNMTATLERDLKSLLAYFGEAPDSPEAPKPEEFFAMICSFSSSLQVSFCCC
jgi:diaphanous 1